MVDTGASATGCHRGEDLVAAVQAALVSVEDANQLAEVFRLLGDGTRTRVLYALLDAGEMCVHDLAAAVEISESRLSHALRLLRTARIVKNRRDGRVVYYSLDDDHVRVLLELSIAHQRHSHDDPEVSGPRPAASA